VDPKKTLFFLDLNCVEKSNFKVSHTDGLPAYTLWKVSTRLPVGGGFNPKNVKVNVDSSSQIAGEITKNKPV